MFSFQYLYYFWIVWIIMNFFPNFGRVNTTSISKITVKSHKLCVKTSSWYIPETIARIFNQQRRGGGQRFRYVAEGGGILLTLRTVTRGEGGPNFRQKQRYVTFEWSLFQGPLQGLQLNGSYLGSSLGFSVIGSSLGFLGPRYISLSLKIYFLKFDIFSWGYSRCSSENVSSILEKLYHLFEWFQS